MYWAKLLHVEHKLTQIDCQILTALPCQIIHHKMWQVIIWVDLMVILLTKSEIQP